MYINIYIYKYICTYKENSNYSLTNRIGIATVTGRSRRLPNVVDAEANLNGNGISHRISHGNRPICRGLAIANCFIAARVWDVGAQKWRFFGENDEL